MTDRKLTQDPVLPGRLQGEFWIFVCGRFICLHGVSLYARPAGHTVAAIPKAMSLWTCLSYSLLPPPTRAFCHLQKALFNLCHMMCHEGLLVFTHMAQWAWSYRMWEGSGSRGSAFHSGSGRTSWYNRSAEECGWNSDLREMGADGISSPLPTDKLFSDSSDHLSAPWRCPKMGWSANSYKALASLEYIPSYSSSSYAASFSFTIISLAFPSRVLPQALFSRLTVG